MRDECIAALDRLSRGAACALLKAAVIPYLSVPEMTTAEREALRNLIDIRR